jgi:hypothetical protein
MAIRLASPPARLSLAKQRKPKGLGPVPLPLLLARPSWNLGSAGPPASGSGQRVALPASADPAGECNTCFRCPYLPLPTHCKQLAPGT